MLAFMFSASWRLTVVTFVLVPMVLLISKVGAKATEIHSCYGLRAWMLAWVVSLDASVCTLLARRSLSVQVCAHMMLTAHTQCRCMAPTTASCQRRCSRRWQRPMRSRVSDG